MRLTMRLNETKRKQRTSQEEVLAEMFAEAELQGSVRKKKNWDAWLEQEEEQQSEKELQVYLEEYSDPTLYLTPKEVKAWNRMPKSKQKRLLEKESRQVLQAWKVGERKGSAGGGRKANSMEELVFLQRRGTQRGTRSGTPLHGIWKPEKGSTKGFGGGETNRSPETQFPRCQADTFKNRKTGGGRSAECCLFCCKQRIHGYSSYTGRQNCKENSTHL